VTFDGISFADGTAANTLVTTSGGNVLLGTTTDSANGILQLTSHTTSAGGIGFGTDVTLYRSAANTLKTDDDLVVAGNVILQSFVSTGGSLGINRNVSTGAILDATKHAYQFQATAAGIDLQAYNTAGTSLGNAFSISGVAVTFGAAIAIGNTVNTVSPTSPNRTVTIVIGGTTYYLHAKTTND
jgi:hypothetical protein